MLDGNNDFIEKAGISTSVSKIIGKKLFIHTTIYYIYFMHVYGYIHQTSTGYCVAVLLHIDRPLCHGTIAQWSVKAVAYPVGEPGVHAPSPDLAKSVGTS